MPKSRKVVVHIATTADSFIARSNGELDWLTSRPAPQGFYGISEFIQSVDTKVLGRKTYESSVRLGAKFDDGFRYIVFSHHPRPAEAPPRVEFVSGIRSFVDSLTEQPGKDIWLMGGGEVITSFLEQQAIDEFIVTVFPLFLGDGIPLIARRDLHVPLKLERAQSFDNGVVQLHYLVEKNGRH